MSLARMQYFFVASRCRCLQTCHPPPFPLDFSVNSMDHPPEKLQAPRLLMTERIRSFREFWPYYLGEHRLARTRHLHFIGSTLSLAWVAAAIAFRSWPLVLAAIGCGYAFAWAGHFLIEKNRPATFRYPLWSLAADWRMWSMMLTGRLASKLNRIRQYASSSGSH